MGGSWVANNKGNQAARNYCWEVAGGRSKPPAYKTSLTKCKHNDKITKDCDRMSALSSQVGTLLGVGPYVMALLTGP